MECAVALVPTPATTFARPPTASLTAARIWPSSATEVVGDSPVVPDTTTPSWPCSTRWAAIRAVPSRSTEPSAWKAVAMAVSTRPNGAAGRDVMSYRLSPPGTGPSRPATHRGPFCPAPGPLTRSGWTRREIVMTVLVVYATRYGATRGIAERIAKTLNQTGHDAQLARASEAGDVKGYDAFVIGSAAYKGGWLDEATDFVTANLDLLADRPVWLFSSGPLGTSPT